LNEPDRKQNEVAAEEAREVLRRVGAGCLFSFGVALLVMTSALYFWYLSADTEAQEALDWPSVPGEILESEISPRLAAGPGSDQTHSLSMRYRYLIDGQQLEGTRLHTLPSELLSGDKAREIQARFPVGAQVSVHYDPEDPQRSLLEPGVALDSELVTDTESATITLIVIALLLLVLAWKVWPSVPGPPQRGVSLEEGSPPS